MPFSEEKSAKNSQKRRLAGHQSAIADATVQENGRLPYAVTINPSGTARVRFVPGSLTPRLRLGLMNKNRQPTTDNRQLPMSDNIYLELELFLDPAITDPAALKLDLEEKINQWNKLVNASPKYKVKVSKAKAFLNNGLTNLDAQAKAARNKIGDQFRTKVKLLKLVGDIDEAGIKMLLGEFKAYFREENIRRGAGGGVASTPKEPAFVVPKLPASLKSEKSVSVLDMQTIRTDFQYVENGRYQDFYAMLNLPASTPTETLLEKAKEESDRVRRITKKDADVDARNRLIGKAINFFKDDPSRRGYDIALKRFPFDLLCDEKFKLLAIKKEITWHIYELSIKETMQAGFSLDEATWLVYDYYCNVKQCPPAQATSRNAAARADPAGSANSAARADRIHTAFLWNRLG